MSEAPGQLNFTMFLTLFGEKLTGALALLGMLDSVFDLKVAWQ